MRKQEAWRTSSSRRGAAEPAPRTSNGSCSSLSLALSKVGRNEPCPCGSGRKFKKCCGG
ncbi:MAG: zinc chelation protein SecC [Armatimonadetes bacterium CG_4_10_14_3_um_filter_66_18]|nr:zinc chelation protein SecC [Armatimonadota bacterium]PIU92946.1 MAG: zinc chelation protein SecC [Armatimonadetes bacterium CG06_land_8_20_14_3_00_66_21]PIX40295.1 MAG: zinc chelation protein SecC [Armatimonadetes bacterium CG_4_8_14_3_um_filter_66_20]PIY37656.1 MAG: zinc chelation protein SecC [Armatimonadetes bacterium CG_4_10_14_3_um_filter_66_18]PIZ33390.1 MAG: zinc chelation protein SecC [Armatimonadetes bacterium CG_4_10_14_0_8_um_filter_66_14]PJB63455.1 MAG: zinc chelation protein S